MRRTNSLSLFPRTSRVQPHPGTGPGLTANTAQTRPPPQFFETAQHPDDILPPYKPPPLPSSPESEYSNVLSLLSNASTISDAKWLLKSAASQNYDAALLHLSRDYIRSGWIRKGINAYLKAVEIVPCVAGYELAMVLESVWSDHEWMNQDLETRVSNTLCDDEFAVQKATDRDLELMHHDNLDMLPSAVKSKWSRPPQYKEESKDTNIFQTFLVELQMPGSRKHRLKEARNYYELSANKGNYKSIRRLVKAYLDGELGLRKDTMEAKKWINTACSARV